MVNKLHKNEQLFIRSMGKAFRVTGIFASERDANSWIERNKDDGVIAVFDDRIYTANLYDQGAPIAA